MQTRTGEATAVPCRATPPSQWVWQCVSTMASTAHRLPAWMREERPAAREVRKAREREAAVGELLQAMCDSVQMANEPPLCVCVPAWLGARRLPPAAEEALRMWSLFMRGTLVLRDGSLEYVSESDEDE